MHYDPLLVEPMRRELADIGVQELRTLQYHTKPDRVATVFAGQDTDATARARTDFAWTLVMWPPA